MLKDIEYLERLGVKLGRQVDRVHAVEADVLRGDIFVRFFSRQLRQLDLVAEDLHGPTAAEPLVGLVEDEAKNVGPLADDRDLEEVDPHLHRDVLIPVLKFKFH